MLFWRRDKGSRKQKRERSWNRSHARVLPPNNTKVPLYLLLWYITVSFEVYYNLRVPHSHVHLWTANGVCPMVTLCIKDARVIEVPSVVPAGNITLLTKTESFSTHAGRRETKMSKPFTPERARDRCPTPAVPEPTSQSKVRITETVLRHNFRWFQERIQPPSDKPYRKQPSDMLSGLLVFSVMIIVTWRSGGLTKLRPADRCRSSLFQNADRSLLTHTGATTTTTSLCRSSAWRGPRLNEQKSARNKL